MIEIFQKSILLLIISMFLLSGCVTTGEYGTFRRDRDLDNMFLSYQVVPGYNYYTSGGYDKPNAILGVHKDYVMVTDFWVSIPNVNSAQMYKWIRSIAPDDRGAGHDYFAAYILDPGGKQVGIWYSIENSTVVKFLEENKIDVYPPDLFQRGDMFNSDGDSGIEILP